MASSDNDPRSPLAQERTELASLRTLWAAERTLMAWMRTSLAMVGSGFAIERVLSHFEPGNGHAEVGKGYFWLGLSMVAAGILLLSLAMWEHRSVLRLLHRQSPQMPVRFSLSLFGSGVVLVIGAMALTLVLLRFPH
jgi:putative membrane protein